MLHRVTLLAACALVAAGCGGGSGGWTLLFASDRDGGEALYGTAPDGGRAERVMASPSFEPVLPSPDGRRFLYGHEYGAVWVVNADGTGRRRLQIKGWVPLSAWTPDGKRIAYMRNPRGIGVVGVDGRGRRPLTDGEFDNVGDWSPDGKWLAFYVSAEGVYAVRADGSHRTAVTPFTADANAVDWSPAGCRIAIEEVDDDSGDTSVDVLDVSGGLPGALEWSARGGDPVWSPDGRTLAYEGAHGIVLADADGRHRRRLVGGATPVWSPDGRRVYFERKDADELMQLWSIGADGSGKRQVTRGYPDGGDNFAAAWVRGPVRTEPRPHATAIAAGRRRVLRVPGLVGEVAVDGSRPRRPCFGTRGAAGRAASPCPGASGRRSRS